MTTAALPYVHVDVFSAAPYSGSSLPVFPDARGLDAGQRLRITQELRHFETIFVDSVPTAEHNGDVRLAIQNDGYSINLLAGEIGDVLSGRLQGRRSAGDITIAKFVGIGAQDLAAAEVALLKLGIL